MKKPEPARSFKIALLLALCVLFWALVSGRREPRAREPVASTAPSAELTPRRARRVRKGAPSAASGPSASDSAGRCSPGAFLRCHEGDVWSEDSCAHLEIKIEECELQLCRDAACEEPDSEPCREPAEGRCDGNVVRLCQAGRSLSIDCGTRGLRCQQGEEGAECAPELTFEERCAGPTRCEGNTLVACLGGKRMPVDCSLLGGRCESLSPTDSPRCVHHMPALPLVASCGPCGCPPGNSGERACDGHDDDGDGYVDEGLSCGAVPIIAFVIADTRGESSFSRDEIEAEIEHANALLAHADELRGRAPKSEAPELAFSLSELIVVSAPDLLELSESAFRDAATDARFHPVRESFYVPMVFTDHLYAQGEVPRIGASTLPNGYCGGAQRGRAPPVGIVAIGKARAPTTVLHELGHFFGLCHTHEQTFGLQTVADDPVRASVVLCGERCRVEGDGVCDTPPDPGPEGCRYDLTCSPLCGRGEAPDALNVMSYYTLCRQHYSPEQQRTVEHTIALRRAWHSCLTKECACELAGDECPVGMTCRPGADATTKGHCALAGPRAPGAPCESSSQCALGVCMSQGQRGASRCVRPCRVSSADCTCNETNLTFSLCREDLGP